LYVKDNLDGKLPQIKCDQGNNYKGISPNNLKTRTRFCY
jgi:hypothetical protein